MSRIVVQEHITLDGVVQGGGGPDEDREGGFELGGWAMEFDDGLDDDEHVVEEWESRTDALLLGRKTYDIWARAWGVWDEDADGLQGEFTRRYNRVPKYVASRTLPELGWRNSHLLRDVPAEVARLRDEPGGEIRVWGSAELVRTLAEHRLIDEYRFIVYPVVLGTGKRLFPEGFPRTSLIPVETRTLPSGIRISRYSTAP